jgi:hypothetical protein
VIAIWNGGLQFETGWTLGWLHFNIMPVELESGFSEIGHHHYA